ncbi:MAG: hypothetical protein ACLFRX_08290, partial [Gemmatimonadota bacterium]
MRVGVLGTLVWDTIDHPDGERIQRWGGIAYSLAAAAAAIRPGWTIRPIIRLGRDLAVEAAAFLDTLPGLERPGGVVVVDEPNNRVHLRYRDRHHRDEILTGGVGTWAGSELEPLLHGLDALYVNMISGFELSLHTVGRLRRAVPGLRYVDLHSLLLGVAPDGTRVPRRLPRRETWLSAFDVVQANTRELSLLAGDDAPEAVAREAVRAGLGAFLVTDGPAGARWYAAPAAVAPGAGAGRASCSRSPPR